MKKKTKIEHKGKTYEIFGYGKKFVVADIVHAWHGNEFTIKGCTVDLTVKGISIMYSAEHEYGDTATFSHDEISSYMDKASSSGDVHDALRYSQDPVPWIPYPGLKNPLISEDDIREAFECVTYSPGLVLHGKDTPKEDHSCHEVVSVLAGLLPTSPRYKYCRTCKKEVL